MGEMIPVSLVAASCFVPPAERCVRVNACTTMPPGCLNARLIRRDRFALHAWNDRCDYQGARPSRTLMIMMAANKERSAPKGFGAPKPPPPPPPPPATKVRRNQAASDFDQLKASGAPEYMVSIRTVNDKGKSDWMPVGGIAVPRSSSEDTAVSMAIFNNEDELLKGAFRNYPKLKSSTDKFEYGFRLKDFPDDPVKIATKDTAKESTNPFMQWFNQLDSPLNND